MDWVNEILSQKQLEFMALDILPDILERMGFVDDCENCRLHTENPEFGRDFITEWALELPDGVPELLNLTELYVRGIYEHRWRGLRCWGLP